MKSLVSLALAALTLAGCGTQTLSAAGVQRGAAAVAAKALEPARFFANAELQAKAPLAFSTQVAAAEAVAAIARTEAPKRDRLVAAIRADQALMAKIDRFGSLTWEQKVPVLKAVMAIECRVLGFEAPKLDFGTDPNPNRESYFDFDPAHPGVGTVILYRQGIEKDTNPYAALLLLVHEVRHAAQFQLGFAKQSASPLAQAFKASFEAQKAMSGKMTFCDFCSLVNEYEAFQCGNYVVGALTSWRVDTADMGCLSSQYDEHGAPRLDLPALHATHPADPVAAFNTLERPQFLAFGGAR
jgi:hypothetical protein